MFNLFVSTYFLLLWRVGWWSLLGTSSLLMALLMCHSSLVPNTLTPNRHRNTQTEVYISLSLCCTSSIELLYPKYELFRSKFLQLNQMHLLQHTVFLFLYHRPPNHCVNALKMATNKVVLCEITIYYPRRQN